MERFSAARSGLLLLAVGDIRRAVRELDRIASDRDADPEAVRVAGRAVEEALELLWAPNIWGGVGDGAKPHGQQSPGYSGGPLQA